MNHNWDLAHAVCRACGLPAEGRVEHPTPAADCPGPKLDSVDDVERCRHVCETVVAADGRARRVIRPGRLWTPQRS